MNPDQPNPEDNVKAEAFFAAVDEHSLAGALFRRNLKEQCLPPLLEKAQSLFQQLIEVCGEQEARVEWEKIPPSRSGGRPANDRFMEQHGEIIIAYNAAKANLPNATQAQLKAFVVDHLNGLADSTRFGNTRDGISKTVERVLAKMPKSQQP